MECFTWQNHPVGQPDEAEAVAKSRIRVRYPYDANAHGVVSSLLGWLEGSGYTGCTVIKVSEPPDEATRYLLVPPFDGLAVGQNKKEEAPKQAKKEEAKKKKRARYAAENQKTVLERQQVGL